MEECVWFICCGGVPSIISIILCGGNNNGAVMLLDGTVLIRKQLHSENSE